MLEKFLPKKFPGLPASQVTFGFLDRECGLVSLRDSSGPVGAVPVRGSDLPVDDSPILARDRRSADLPADFDTAMMHAFTARKAGWAGFEPDGDGSHASSSPPSGMPARKHFFRACGLASDTARPLTHVMLHR
jgi:hypothetical protein